MALKALRLPPLRLARRCAVRALVEQRLQPLQEKEPQLVQQRKQLEAAIAKVSADLADTQRRCGEAQERLVHHDHKKQEILKSIMESSEHADRLKRERDAKQKEIVQKAQDIGDETVEQRMQQVHDSSSMEQYVQSFPNCGSSLRDYAQLHHDLLLCSNNIKNANADVTKTDQVLEEQEKKSSAAQQQMKALQETQLKLKMEKGSVESRLQKISQEKSLVASYQDTLQRTVQWAQMDVPDVSASAQNLPLLALVRRESIANSIQSCNFKRLKQLNASAAEMRDLCNDLMNRLSQGFSSVELKQMGFRVEELCKNFSAADLLRAGFSREELAAYPSVIQKLKADGFSLGQLKELGFGVQELGVAFRAKELVAAGFNKEQLQAFPKIGLALKKDGFSARQLKDMGFKAAELHFSALELALAGFSQEELTAAGLPEVLIKAVLHFREGCSMAELFKHFGPSELKAAGFGPQQVYPDSTKATAWFRYQML
ncbi:unnamed protein product [Effrenium voratum]|uniref:Uncharacterized protein n=1 Tax=Effrenium voratum TaxID=2562239 RepID=A0AA36IAK4_9DINO|nr:unnamed protein product [Effrenium voratum]